MTTTYSSPTLKVIKLESLHALCANSPSDTEPFTVSSNSYSDEDFE